MSLLSCGMLTGMDIARDMREAWRLWQADREMTTGFVVRGAIYGGGGLRMEQKARSGTGITIAIGMRMAAMSIGIR
jgi:hypothetical protein